MRPKNVFIATVLSTCFLSAPGAVAADVKGTIQYRQNYMNAISGHTGALRRLKDGRFSAAGHMQMHASALAQLTRDIALLFPPGTLEGKTDAKPQIWENWSDFEAQAAASQQAAQALLEAVETGDSTAIDARFGELTDTCKACHRPFRK